MSEEVTEQTESPRQVTDELEVVVADGLDPKQFDDFLENLQELKAKYAASPYNDFQLSVVTRKNTGVLLLNGLRDETKQEAEEREQRETQEKQRVEQAELKEYLRLKKKYGKKSEQNA